MRSGHFELYYVELQLLLAALLLLLHAQVAEAVEQLPGLLLVLQAEVLPEEGEVVGVRVGVVDEDGLGEVVQPDLGLPLLRDFPRLLGDL